MRKITYVFITELQNMDAEGYQLTTKTKLYSCSGCGNLVVDKKVHANFHKELETR